jgi:hypothetical protein
VKLAPTTSASTTRRPNHAKLFTRCVLPIVLKILLPEVRLAKCARADANRIAMWREGRRRVLVFLEEGKQMRKRTVGIFTILVTGVVLLAAVSVASGSASATKYTAKLTGGQEVPKGVGVPASATGTFTATLTGSTLKWTLTYAHLSGGAVAAHIHLGKKGVAGNVIVPLCATPTSCKSPIKGSAKISAAWVKDMTAGKTYVNIHTKKNPGGEIRGQVGM